MIITTAEEMRMIEKKAVEQYGIPESLLMENAAVAIAAELKHRDKNTRIAILAGIGNNAGDGFAAARHLIALGFTVTVFHPCNTTKYKDAALLNYEILRKMDADLRVFTVPYDFSCYDVIIDALFGIGLNRPLSGEYADIVEAANKSHAFKIAADIPSGLVADSPAINGSVFIADVTVSFTALKACHALLPAREYCGKIIIANISIAANSTKTFTLDAETLPKLKRRAKDTHKGNYGHAFVIAGSKNMTGAATLTSAACMKIGAGLTTCVLPADIAHVFLSTYPEIMGFSLSDETVSTINEKASVFSIGNGMGTAPETKKLILDILKNTDKPTIVDADAINSLTLQDLTPLRSRAVMTPHLKEFARLTGVDIAEIKNKPIDTARDFAQRYGIVLVLKSADTVIAMPDGRVYISSYGSPALAKGGSGDILAGIITGLAAQKYSLEESALLGCAILGKSAEYAAKRGHEMTVSASDIIYSFGDALNEL